MSKGIDSIVRRFVDRSTVWTLRRWMTAWADCDVMLFMIFLGLERLFFCGGLPSLHTDRHVPVHGGLGLRGETSGNREIETNGLGLQAVA